MKSDNKAKKNQQKHEDRVSLYTITKIKFNCITLAWLAFWFWRQPEPNDHCSILPPSN